MALVICSQSYDSADQVAQIAHMPGLLILTGSHDGLSAPILFDHELAKQSTVISGKVVARMTLEAAIDFVMALEEREELALGHQPDMAAALQDPFMKKFFIGMYAFQARKLGWNEEEEPFPSGPSSTWVDREMCADCEDEGIEGLAKRHSSRVDTIMNLVRNIELKKQDSIPPN